MSWSPDLPVRVAGDQEALGVPHTLRGSPGARSRSSGAGSSTDAARTATRTLLDRPKRPTAIMAHYDDLAIGALLAAKDVGIAVPRELSVMGCDDGPAAIASDLTTIRQPFRESGAAALRILLTMIIRLRCHVAPCSSLLRWSSGQLRAPLPARPPTRLTGARKFRKVLL